MIIGSVGAAAPPSVFTATTHVPPTSLPGSVRGTRRLDC